VYDYRLDDGATVDDDEDDTEEESRGAGRKVALELYDFITI